MLYLYRNPSQYDDWYGVVIFYSRSLEPTNASLHRSLINSSQVQRIYLDELSQSDQQSLGISLIQLTIATQEQMVAQARRLIDRAQTEESGSLSRDAIIEVITTIVVYKVSRLSREEVEAMLGVDLETTRVYQDAKAEGKAEGREEMKAEMLRTTVPLLLQAGLSFEQIAQQLKVNVNQVHQAVEAL